MPNYKNNYITYDDFECLQLLGLGYEGFVKGYGYVYSVDFAIPPMHMQINSQSPYAPPGFDEYILGSNLCLDNSRRQ